MEMICVRRLKKVVIFLARGTGYEVLLTGVPLCLSLPGSNRTVLVGEQNLLQLTHLRPQRRHLILGTHREILSILEVWLVFVCVLVCVRSMSHL